MREILTNLAKGWICRKHWRRRAGCWAYRVCPIWRKDVLDWWLFRSTCWSPRGLGGACAYAICVIAAIPGISVKRLARSKVFLVVVRGSGCSLLENSRDSVCISISFQAVAYRAIDSSMKTSFQIPSSYMSATLQTLATRLPAYFCGLIFDGCM